MREGLDRRQRPHPSFEIGNNSLDLSLLEHDFGDPDGVGIARAPPREIAGVVVIPAGQFSSEGFQEEIKIGVEIKIRSGKLPPKKVKVRRQNALVILAALRYE